MSEQDEIPMTGGDTTDVDSLLQSIEQPGSTDIPMKAETPEPSPQPQAPSELEFSWKDKQIKVPYSDARVKQWASQGYDYAQRMAEFKQQEQAFTQKQQQISELEQMYGPVDKYVRENPDWWNHVMQQYQTRQQQAQATQDPNNPVLGVLNDLQSKLQQHEQFISESTQEKLRLQREKDDQALTGDIQSIRDTYKNIDFDTPDEFGKSLEYKVLEHAHQNGIRNFKTAFKDFYHDQLMKHAEERGKQNVQNDIQKKTKLGLLGTSQAPKKAINSAQNVKNKSYNELYREALDELGIN